MLALLKPGDTTLGMDLASGGHLTHGAAPNQSGKWFNAIQYGVRRQDEISGKIAKELFEIVWEKGGNPKDIVKEKGMTQVTDVGAIEAEVDKIINENPDQVEKAKTNPKLAGWMH